MIKAIESLAESYTDIRDQTLSDGTRLIGNVPRVAPLAFTLILYAPLNEDEIHLMIHQLNRRSLNGYEAFLRSYNGISIFVGALSLFGLRRILSRDGLKSRQPFDLVKMNTLNRPFFLESSELVIGNYNDDGAVLTLKSNSVVTRYQTTGEIVKSWLSLGIFLDSEVTRLATRS